MRAALVASTLARVMVGGEHELQDFMLTFDSAKTREKAQSPEYIFNVLRFASGAKAKKT